MKSFLTTLFFATFLPSAGQAQVSAELELGKGSVLTYAVKDGAASYTLKATLTDFAGTYTDFNIAWKISGGKASSGTIQTNADALLYADGFNSSLKAGAQQGSEEGLWFFLGNNNAENFDTGLPMLLKVDGEQLMLNTDDHKTTQYLTYNNEPEAVQVQTAESAEPAVMLQVLSISGAHLATHFKKGGYEMKLLSIYTPKQKTMEDVANLLKDAPKNTRLVKMPAEKFSTVSRKYPILATIESFDATAGGKQRKPFTETYDYRATSGATLPPSLVDCFITDLMMLYKKVDGSLTLSSRTVPAEAAQKAMNVYRTKEANDIIGYRPYTHWKFVRSLDADQQKKLADEVAAYALEFGVKEI